MEKIKKADLTRDFLRDMWLSKYHNTNSEEVAKKHPEEVKTPEWFKLYPCTQEQAEEWERDAKALIKRVLKISNYILEREWGFIYLDVAPDIKQPTKSTD